MKQMQLNGRLACTPAKATIKAKSSLAKFQNLQLAVNIIVLVLLTRQHGSSGKIMKGRVHWQNHSLFFINS
jgi:hypothetical protein